MSIDSFVRLFFSSLTRKTFVVREKKEIERKDDEGLFLSNALIVLFPFFSFIEAGIAVLRRTESLTRIMCRFFSSDGSRWNSGGSKDTRV